MTSARARLLSRASDPSSSILRLQVTGPRKSSQNPRQPEALSSQAEAVPPRVGRATEGVRAPRRRGVLRDTASSAQSPRGEQKTPRTPQRPRRGRRKYRCLSTRTSRHRGLATGECLGHRPIEVKLGARLGADALTHRSVIRQPSVPKRERQCSNEPRTK